VTIPGLTTRVFDIDQTMARRRIVPVGDMTTVTTVEVNDINGDLIEATTSYVKLPRIRQEWEPITELWFPMMTDAAPMAVGYSVEVVGVWGFPAIPADVVVAVAKLVLVRFIADAASSGTALADALNEQGFDAGGAFASAMDVLRNYEGDCFV
jgi:hypothetical protein